MKIHACFVEDKYIFVGMGYSPADFMSYSLLRELSHWPYVSFFW